MTRQVTAGIEMSVRSTASEQAQRLFALPTQLGGQVGECDVAVQQLLDQRMKLVPAHV